MEKTELRRVYLGEHVRGLTPSQIELLNRVETAGGLDLDEAPCPIEEVKLLIEAGFLRLEVTSFPWGIDFRVAPAIGSDSGTNEWKEVSERDAAN